MARSFTGGNGDYSAALREETSAHALVQPMAYQRSQGIGQFTNLRLLQKHGTGKHQVVTQGCYSLGDAPIRAKIYRNDYSSPSLPMGTFTRPLNVAGVFTVVRQAEGSSHSDVRDH